MSSSDIIKAFEEAGIKPSGVTVIKETPESRRRHKEVIKFLKDLEAERNKPLPNMVFK